MAVIAEYDRTEIYLEYALLTAFGNPLLGKYLLRRNCTRTVSYTHLTLPTI